MRFASGSVRFRLTLWYSATLGAIVLVFAIVVYAFVQATLSSQMDHRLEGELEAVLAAALEELDEIEEELEEIEERGALPFFRISLGDSKVYASSGWKTLGLDGALPIDPPKKSWSWRSPEGQTFRLRGGSAQDRGQDLMATVAADESAIQRTLSTLAVVLAIAIPCALALSLGGGYFLTGQLLSPIAAMTAKAKSITADQLAQRLPVVNPRDELGQLAMVFNDTLGRLETAFDRLHRFTADASHELRTPLTAIRSVGEVGMREDREGKDYREVIGSMLEEVDRLARLVENLLILTRADNGKFHVSKELVDLGSIVKDVAETLNVLAEEKNQSLSFDTALGVNVHADPVLLRQAIMNLVDNAIKFTPLQGNIEILVGRTNGQTAEVAITDDGPGIPADSREKVFDRFYRIDPGRSRESGGTGLGLAIARWAVEANGGRIEVDSNAGHGCRVRVHLPVERGNESC